LIEIPEVQHERVEIAISRSTVRRSETFWVFDGLTRE